MTLIADIAVWVLTIAEMLREYSDSHLRWCKSVVAQTIFEFEMS